MKLNQEMNCREESTLGFSFYLERGLYKSHGVFLSTKQSVGFGEEIDHGLANRCMSMTR